MNQSKKLTDGALLLAVYTILLLILTYIPIPILSLVTFFLLPVPFILYASKYDYKPTFIVLILAIILTIMFASVFSLATPIIVGLGGMMIGGGIYRNMEAFETLARGTFGFIIGLLFFYLYTQVLFDINWIQDIKQMVTESMDMSRSVFEQFGLGTETDVEEILQGYITYITNLLPMFLVLSALVFAFISQWIGYRMINRLENKELKFPPFRSIQFPTSFIWIYFIALILSFLIADTSSLFYIAIQNIVMIISVFLTIQGFSFIFFYTHHKEMSKSIPVIAIIAAIILPLLIDLVRIIGILDIGFKLREQLKKK